MDVISIITPSYNSKHYFLETFNSVIRQTYKDYEWIIVDDCSADGSYEFIGKLIKDYKNIILIKTNKNCGAAAARNLGIKAANGRYIAFLDADDIWMPNKLEIQLKFMKDKNCAFSFAAYDVIFPNKKIKTFMPKHEIETHNTLLKSCNIGCLTVMIDTLKIGKIYMPTDTPKREDYATWLDITKNGINGYRIPKSLATYRISDGSVSHNKLSLMKYHYNVYRKHEKMSFLKSHFYLIIHSSNKVLKKY